MWSSIRFLRQDYGGPLRRAQAAQAGQEHGLRPVWPPSCSRSIWPWSRAACASNSQRRSRSFELNFSAVKAGFDYAAQNLTKQDPYFIERMNQTAGKIIIDGNAACGMGAVFAGVTVGRGYPIYSIDLVIVAATDLLKKFA